MRSLRTAAASFVVAVLTLCAAPRAASAQEEANGLGQKGQLILTVDRLMPVLSFSSVTETSTVGGANREDSQTGTSIALLLGREPSLGIVHTVPRIAFDYTIINRLTLGGSFAVAFGLGGEEKSQVGNNNVQTRNTPRRSLIGFAPRVGYVLPIGRNFAFWPRAGFAFYSVSTKEDIVVNNMDAKRTNSDTIIAIDLDPQFAWIPIPHFFFHFGPLLNIPIGGSRSVETEVGASSNTQKSDLSVLHFGLSAGLGGWFDL